ncbi:MAG: YihY/virulence factor BrkB family protein [Caldilineaceae bacterium]
MNEENEASTWEMIKTTFSEWNADNATRLAAAIAYYTIFSIAPLLVIAVAVAGFILGQGSAKDELLRQVQNYTGSPQATEFVQGLIENAAKPSTGIFASIVGVIGLLFGASGVFSELQNSLNQIWNVEPKSSGIQGMLLKRALALLMVLLSGLLLLASVVLTTALTAAGQLLNQLLPGIAFFIPLISFLVLFAITVLIFALIYKYLPDIQIAWSDVWIGAIATALLFSIGRYLISLYLGYSSATSAYGAAGSLALLLLWIYYSAQIFFLGAEFTQVYSRMRGSRQHERDHVDDKQKARDKDAATSDQQSEPRAPDLNSGQPRARRSVTRPAVELVAAVGAIAALSLFNLIRSPFRK